MDKQLGPMTYDAAWALVDLARCDRMTPERWQSARGSSSYAGLVRRGMAERQDGPDRSTSVYRITDDGRARVQRTEWMRAHAQKDF